MKATAFLGDVDLMSSLHDSMRKPLAGHSGKKGYTGRYLLLPTAVAYIGGGKVAATREMSSARVAPGHVDTTLLERQCLRTSHFYRRAQSGQDAIYLPQPPQCFPKGSDNSNSFKMSGEISKAQSVHLH